MARGVKAEQPSNREEERRLRSGRTRSVTDLSNTVPQQQQPQQRVQKQNQRQQRQRGQQPQAPLHHEEQQNVPEQDVAQRRALRSRYLAVKNVINEEREEIYRPGSAKFDSIINEVQTLHKQVHKPREQVVDAEALLDITNSLFTSVKAHKSEGVTPADFVNSLIRNFARQDTANDVTEGSGYMILWKEIGLAVSHIFKRGSGCGTMLGPMNCEFKQKQRKACVRRRYDRHAESAHPEQLNSNKEEMTDTDKNMATMFEILKKNRKVQLEKLILNRNSFAQTVENLFALSFLAKDGRAAIIVDEDGCHFVSPKNAPAANAVASGQVSYSHFVFRFDFRDWKLMLDSVGDGDVLMPHRKSTNMAGSSNPAHDPSSAEPEAAGLPTTPIRKLSRNRGLVLQEQVVIEDSPDNGDSGSKDAAIRRGKRKLL